MRASMRGGIYMRAGIRAEQGAGLGARRARGKDKQETIRSWPRATPRARVLPRRLSTCRPWLERPVMAAVGQQPQQQAEGRSETVMVATSQTGRLLGRGLVRSRRPRRRASRPPRQSPRRSPRQSLCRQESPGTAAAAITAQPMAWGHIRRLCCRRALRRSSSSRSRGSGRPLLTWPHPPHLCAPRLHTADCTPRRRQEGVVAGCRSVGCLIIVRRSQHNAEQ